MNKNSFLMYLLLIISIFFKIEIKLWNDDDDLIQEIKIKLYNKNNDLALKTEINNTIM